MTVANTTDAATLRSWGDVGVLPHDLWMEFTNDHLAFRVISTIHSTYYNYCCCHSKDQ